MNPVQAVKSGFRHYAVFSGRASRSEYWWFVLFLVVVFMFFRFLIGPLFVTIIDAVFIVPYIAIGSRRLHDRGWSGWWIAPIAFNNIILIGIPWYAAGSGVEPAYAYIWFIFRKFDFGIFPIVYVVQIVYGIFIFILACLPGTKGENRFGSDPLQSTGRKSAPGSA